MSYLPECVATNDHYWHGRSICSACGTRLRCMCGRFVRDRDADWRAHEKVCPTLAKLPEFACVANGCGFTTKDRDEAIDHALSGAPFHCVEPIESGRPSPPEGVEP